MEAVRRDRLRNAPYNPRRMDDAAKKLLRKSLERHGLVEALVWNKRTGNLVGGHQRLEQLDALEGSNDYELEVCVVDVDEREEAALNVQLNQRSMQGDWDPGKLEALVNDFGFDPREDLAFMDADIKALFKAGYDDLQEDGFDVDAEYEKPAFSRPGDLWTLGRHKVLCGDSTKPGDVARLMGGEMADIMVTDPPYNVGYTGRYRNEESKDDRDPLLNDSMGGGEYRDFLKGAFLAAKAHMKPGAAFYIWHAAMKAYSVLGAVMDAGWKMRQQLVWKKHHFAISRQDYQWIHEPCLYGRNGDAFDEGHEPCFYGWNGGGPHGWHSDRRQTTVLEFDKPLASSKHPTMKPVPLIGHLVINSSKQGDVVLDSFLGSGTAVIACEQAGRACRGIELDPKYVDVTVGRYVECAGGPEGAWLLRDGKKLAYGDAARSG